MTASGLSLFPLFRGPVVRTVFLICVAALLLGGAAALPAQAQTANDALRFGQVNPASGARMVGLGGAGIGGVADYGMLFTNPAALGWMDASQFVGSIDAAFATDEATYDPVPLDGTSLPLTTTQQSASSYRLGNLGLAYKLPTTRGSLVLAGGLNQTAVYDRTLAYDGVTNSSSITDTFLPQPGRFSIASDGTITFDSDLARTAFNAGAIEVFSQDPYPFQQAVNPGAETEQRDEVVEEGRFTEASFGGGIAIAPGVMAGAALNIGFGSYTFSRFYREIDVDDDTPDAYSVLLGDGTLLEGFDELQVEEEISSELVGVGLRAGLSAAPVPALRLGLTLETPTLISVEETFGTRVAMTFDAPNITRSAGATDDNTFEYRVVTPWRVGVGARLKVAGLTVTADLEGVDWTQLRLNADDADFSAENRFLRDFRRVVQPRIGAEYDFGPVAVRGGFAYQPDPRPEDVRITLADGSTTDRAKTFWSAGLSYTSGDFTLNLAWQQERFDDQYRPYDSGPIPANVEDSSGNLTVGSVDITAPFVDETITRTRLLIGIAYRL